MKKTFITNFPFFNSNDLYSVTTTHANRRGFTLVETLVAIAIIMIAITGPYAAAVQAITAARIARNYTTATFLAQEGIEIVRAERDKVYLHDCLTTSGCDTSTWWQNDFANSTNPSSGSHNIFQCSKSSPCVFDASKSFKYKLFLNSSNSALLFESMLPRQPSSRLYLQHPASLTSFLYDYQTSPPAIQTPFTRSIYASSISSTEIEIVSKVTWKDNGKSFKVTAKDHLTSWSTQ